MAIFFGTPNHLLAQEIVSQQTVAEFDGIQVITGNTSYCEFHVALISLCTEGVSMNVSAPFCLPAKAWGNQNGVQVAVTGDYGNYTTAEVCPCSHGLTVADGQSWPNQHMACDPNAPPLRAGWIGFGPNRVEFSHTAQVKMNPAIYNASQGFRPNEVTSDLPAGTSALISGYPELVTEGFVNDCSSPYTTLFLVCLMNTSSSSTFMIISFLSL